MSKKLHLSSGQRWLVENFDNGTYHVAVYKSLDAASEIDVHLAVSRLDHAPVNSWDVLQREAAPWVKK